MATRWADGLELVADLAAAMHQFVVGLQSAGRKPSDMPK